MGLTDVKTIIKDFSRFEQIELAMYILQNIQTSELHNIDEKNDDLWFTKEVEQEVMRRKEAAIKYPEQSLSYEEVMKTIRQL